METLGDRVIQFIETFLTLGGSFLGQPFLLLPFQREVIRDMYRTRPDGLRQYRTYVLGLPRKNGKSQLGAALALYHLIVDRADSAPQVISAAGDRKQARLVFDEARRMVLASPELREVCTVHRDVIKCHLNEGTYRAVSADAGLQQGLNPSMVVFDEYHIFKDSELYEALNLGSATRRSPFTLVISTAGYDLESPFGRLYQYGRKLHSGEVEDPAFGMTWYGPDLGEDFDPADPEVWKRHNPSWALMNVSEFEAAYRTTHESAFIRYRLNGWTSSETAWLPNGAWDGRLYSRQTPAILPLAPGDEVVLGFDGAWKGDSTGLIAVRIKDLHVEVLGHWEAPPDDPHWRTPAGEVEEAIRQACERFTVREVAADPWRFEQSLLKLYEEGLPIVEFPSNSLARIVPATQAFYDAVMDGRISHDGDPALARHIANAVLKEDARGGRITKERKSSKRHIDLAVAAVIGVHRALVWREEEEPEDAQLLVL
jgi:phage terminase large subunit-like protein